MRYHRTNNGTRSDAAGRPLPPPFTWSLRDPSHICSAESLAYRHEQLGYLALRVPECNTVISALLAYRINNRSRAHISFRIDCIFSLEASLTGTVETTRIIVHDIKYLDWSCNHLKSLPYWFSIDQHFMIIYISSSRQR